MELAERVLTMKEAAEFLDIAYERFRKKRSEYKISFFHKGDKRTKFFDKLELEKFRTENLNLLKSQHSHWSEKDIEKLKQWAGTMRFSHLAHKLCRSISSVKSKLEDLGMNQKNAQGEWTTPELSEVLQVSVKAIRMWITARRLKVRLAHFDETNPKVKTYLINLKNLFLFFRANPEIYDISKLSEEAKLQLGLEKLPSPPAEKLLYCKRCDRTFWAKLFSGKPRCPFCNFWVSKYAVKGENEKGERFYRCEKDGETFWEKTWEDSTAHKAPTCPICRNTNKIYRLNGTYRWTTSNISESVT